MALPPLILLDPSFSIDLPTEVVLEIIHKVPELATHPSRVVNVSLTSKLIKDELDTHIFAYLPVYDEPTFVRTLAALLGSPTRPVGVLDLAGHDHLLHPDPPHLDLLHWHLGKRRVPEISLAWCLSREKWALVAQHEPELLELHLQAWQVDLAPSISATPALFPPLTLQHLSLRTSATRQPLLAELLPAAAPTLKTLALHLEGPAPLAIGLVGVLQAISGRHFFPSMWHLTLTVELLDYSDLDLVWHFLPFTSLRSLVLQGMPTARGPSLFLSDFAETISQIPFVDPIGVYAASAMTAEDVEALVAACRADSRAKELAIDGVWEEELKALLPKLVAQAEADGVHLATPALHLAAN